MTELQIEGGFGELRKASINSQLNVRSFSCLSARRTIQAVRRASMEAGGNRSKKSGGGVVTPKQFFSQISDTHFCLGRSLH